MLLPLLLCALPQQEVAILQPHDPGTFDEFGSAVALDGNVALVGAHAKPYQGLNYAGAAYVYRRVNGVWSEEAKLTVPVPEIHDNFGTSVAIQGNVAVIGAPDFAVSSFSGTGRAWVFRRVQGQWTLEQELVPSVAAWDSGSGRAVALDGNTIVMNCSPAPLFSPYVAVVYEYNGSAWVEQQVISTPGPASFAREFSLQGNRLAINAPGEMVNGLQGVGAVYVYERLGSQWSQTARLIPVAPSDGEAFGTTLALDGDRLAIGAPLDNIRGMTDAGRVDLFRRQGSSWQWFQSLESSLPSGGAQFGLNVALAGDACISASYYPSSGSPDLGGAMHVYREGPPNSWHGGTASYPTNAGQALGFGWSLALSGTTVLLGTVQNEVRVWSTDGGFRLGGIDPDSQLKSDDFNLFQVTGGLPQQATWLAYSLLGFGTRNIPSLGITLDLNGPAALGGMRLTDASGQTSWSLFLPANAADRSAWWQAVQAGQVSNAWSTFIR